MASSHRPLPPPSAMGLLAPAPRPGQPPPTIGSSGGGGSQLLGPLPGPPQPSAPSHPQDGQWSTGQSDEFSSMRHWLNAKAEEEKRRQEEERSHQETSRLEQRRIEQAMLRESLQAGVPPPMVPIIFAGIGGSSLSSVAIDWLQQYAAQVQGAYQQPPPPAQQQQQQPPSQPPMQQPLPPPPPTHSGQQAVPSSPDVHRDARLQGMGAVAPVYSYLQPAPAPVSNQMQPIEQPGYQPYSNMPPLRPQAPPQPVGVHASRSAAAHSQLPRLATHEIYVAPGAGVPASALPYQQQPSHPVQLVAQQQQEQQASSPSIYFHYWQPPGDSKSGGASANTSAQSAQSAQAPPLKRGSAGETPSALPVTASSQHQRNLSYESETRDSPSRKRKAQGGHQPLPAPSTVLGSSGSAGAGHINSPPNPSASPAPSSRRADIPHSLRPNRQRSNTASSAPIGRSSLLRNEPAPLVSATAAPSPQDQPPQDQPPHPQDNPRALPSLAQFRPSSSSTSLAREPQQQHSASSQHQRQPPHPPDHPASQREPPSHPEAFTSQYPRPSSSSAVRDFESEQSSHDRPSALTREYHQPHPPPSPATSFVRDSREAPPPPPTVTTVEPTHASGRRRRGSN